MAVRLRSAFEVSGCPPFAANPLARRHAKLIEHFRLLLLDSMSLAGAKRATSKRATLERLFAQQYQRCRTARAFPLSLC